MPADILIYALVAAGLVFWLRNILGTRHGDERQRPNPFTPRTEDDPATRADPAAALHGGDVPSADAAPDPLALPGTLRAEIAATATAGLSDILRADRNFELAPFIGGAQDAFVMIVEAFAAGDRELLKSLLNKDLYRAFDDAISAREKAGEKMETEIHAIRKTEVIEAAMRDRMAVLTLRFVADETVVVRDGEGNILSGHPDRVSETIDVWTFGRDVKSKDPTWFLLATREGDEG